MWHSCAQLSGGVSLPSARTSPPSKRIASLGMPKCLAATSASRPRISSHAMRVAAPFRSAPELAAVAEVLGTLSVRVGAIRMNDNGTPSALAAIWATLVCSPCPISVPPWVTSTDPSL